MKDYSHLSFLLLLTLIITGCIDGESASLEMIGGNVYPYHSTITALIEPNDSLLVKTNNLLVGTTDGIALFNLKNGLFKELRSFRKVNESNGAIYDIIIDKNDI